MQYQRINPFMCRDVNHETLIWWSYHRAAARGVSTTGSRGRAFLARPRQAIAEPAATRRCRNTDAARRSAQRRRCSAAADAALSCLLPQHGWRGVARTQIIGVSRARANGLLRKRRHLLPPIIRSGKH